MAGAFRWGPVAKNSLCNVAGEQVEHNNSFWRLIKKHYFNKYFWATMNIASIFEIEFNVNLCLIIAWNVQGCPGYIFNQKSMNVEHISKTIET